jgi:Uma2 family endonuclease
MIDAGILTKYDRCELIRGELVARLAVSDPHAAVVRRLNGFFNPPREEEDYIVGVRSPIKLEDSRPDTDLTLLRYKDDFYSSGTATPPDIFLVVEVADTSLKFDRAVRRPLYAENGIQEYWIVNRIEDCVEVHREPQISGEYASHWIAGRGESITLSALPDISVPLNAILGRQTG